jgi:hypothetical protein
MIKAAGRSTLPFNARARHHHSLSRLKPPADTSLHVIASAAKQSIVPQRKYGLLRRVAPRNDAEGPRIQFSNSSSHSFAISPRVLREFCRKIPVL